ncbi:MAG TPA: lysophospholipid acyltransferase family protein [Niabella sp.]|nr:lysophospholipid acyltransferase family protein [Niabella sp.]HOZ96601.1 lysophospholipid acyltransferase family protein [Niabella sp.]HQW14531.1 lysophospholipid acyltransferase family protein [Niabella sp.]HQX19946.1 lysophospholipid acyltransferase family protein [Niabella sp.]HQX41177.1 lysophospholipid acyltransferase family protein [Niabella sp.]
MLKLFRFLFSIYAAILFVAIMLLIFPLVIAASFFGRIKGGNMIYRLCVLWADIWFALTFIRVKKIYDVPYDHNGKYIIVANHISYLDIPMLVKVFRTPLRPLGKIEMTKIPVFGFIYKNTIVTVDRENTKNRAESLRILRSILNKGISILVFPEGTFNETENPLKDFYSGAFKLAVETGTAIQPVLFLDTYRRMHYRSIFSLNPGKSRVLFLKPHTISAQSNYQELKEKVYLEMEQKLIALKADWIKKIS